jgi:hypothetical protein
MFYGETVSLIVKTMSMRIGYLLNVFGAVSV